MSREPIERVTCDRCKADILVDTAESRAAARDWGWIAFNHRDPRLPFLAESHQPHDLCAACLHDLLAWFLGPDAPAVQQATHSAPERRRPLFTIEDRRIAETLVAQALRDQVLAAAAAFKDAPTELLGGTIPDFAFAGAADRAVATVQSIARHAQLEADR